MKIKAEYNMYTEGMFSGVMGYTLTFSGKTLKPVEVADTVLGIREYNTTLKRPLPTVKLEANMYPTDNVMIMLLKPLRDMGHKILAVVDGLQGFKTWYTLVHVLCVQVSGEKLWAPYSCAELRYTPSECVEPPMITEPQPPALYLDITLSQATTNYFFKKSRYKWNVLNVIPQKFSEVVVEV